ncbi:MAG TPA: hypothetical protein VF235_01800 [Actinomycetota bacterium]
MTRWALEGAVNPTLLRVHVGVALTDETIVTCPPATAPPPVDRLLEIGAIRSLDVHRYRVRLNLFSWADREETARHASEILEHAWGAATPLAPDEGPRAFVAETGGLARRVAESPRMARGSRLLEAVFAVDGVSEAIAGDGLVLVRLGRVFVWDEAEAAVGRALAQSSVGMPGSTSEPR